MRCEKKKGKRMLTVIYTRNESYKKFFGKEAMVYISYAVCLLSTWKCMYYSAVI